jgi:SAM-dependent methyltransferase
MTVQKPKLLTGVSPEQMREMFRFERSRILLTAYELGLFTELGDTAKPSRQVAEAIGADPRATDRLMNALCAMGILSKEGTTFRNSEAAARLLVKGAEGYMAGLMHMVHLWDSWSKLTEAVRRGTWVPKTELKRRTEKELEAFIAAMHANALARAPAVVGLLDLAGVSNVLDVGGGSGGYAMAFARAKPGLRATVFDLSNVIPLTRRYIDEGNLGERVTTAGGDYLSDSLGQGFDLAFLSMIVHSNPPEQNRALLGSVGRCLRPSGRVVIHEMVLDEDRTWPAYAAVFALNMLVNTEAGDSYTESEIQDWMTGAGFGHFSRIDTPFETSLVMGTKL